MYPQQIPASTPRRLHLRLAEGRDVLALKRFYLAEMREKEPTQQEAFPIPCLQEITDSIDDENFLLVEDLSDGKILAASGIFRLVHHDDGVFGELSGMCASSRIVGLKPHSMQRLMLAIRIIRASADLVGDIGSSALVSFVGKTNEPSADNLRTAGLECVEDEPEWLRDEYVSWFGWTGVDDWQAFQVGERALRWSAVIINLIEREHATLELSRVDRASKQIERFFLTFQPKLWIYALPDVADILRRGVPKALGQPPRTLSFHGRGVRARRR